MDVMRRADWVVDIGPAAGEGGGQVLYSGPVAGLEHVQESVTGSTCSGERNPSTTRHANRMAGCD